MNSDMLMGRWKQLRGRIKAKWGRLTDDELNEVEGNYEMLVGKLQEKYGTTREQIERELDAFVSQESAQKPR